MFLIALGVCGCQPGVLIGPGQSSVALSAPAEAQAGEAVVFEVQLASASGEPSAVEVIDQQLGHDLLLASATADADGAFVARWTPDAWSDGPYLLRAKVVFTSGEVRLSDALKMTVSLLDTFAKKGPEGVGATAGDGQVSLSWASVNRASGYYLYRGTESGFATSLENRVADSAAPSAVDATVTNGTTYYYVVTSYFDNPRSGKQRESAPSAEIAVTPSEPDREPPQVTITSLCDETITSAQTFAITADALDNVGVAKVEFYEGGVSRGSDADAPYSHAWTVTGAENGEHIWTARACDAAGNCTVSAECRLVVDIQGADTSPPTVSISAPAADTSYTAAQTVAIVATATDDVGVVKVEFYDGTTLKKTDTTSPYSYNWTFDAADNGAHSFTARAFDAAGNNVLSSARLLTVSVLLPPQAPTGVSAAAGDRQNTISWNAVGGATSYNLYWSTTSGVTPASGVKRDAVTSPHLHSGLVNGIGYHYVVTAVNAAGEGPPSAEASATPTASSDTSPPTVSITSPSCGQVYTEPGTIVLTATASDNIGVTRVEFRDGAVLKGIDASAPFTRTWSFTDASNGSHSWTARAFDAAGNSTTSSTCTFTVAIPVDSAPPTVAISSPAANTTYTSARVVTLVATADDDVGVTKVEFYDGSALERSDTAAPYTHSWTVDAAANGAHSWTAKAYDDDGNSTTSAVRLLTVDIGGAVLPAPTGVSVAAANAQNTISWNPVAGALGYRLYWSTSPGVTPAGGTQIATTSPYLHTGLTNGTSYYYVVTAVDGNGEGSPSAEVSATPQGGGPEPPYVTDIETGVGLTMPDFTLPDENGNDWTFYDHYQQAPAVVILYNQISYG